MAEQNTPIVIVKRMGRHGGHHGGAWKVAYADFVTAMMALFIVLWLMTSSETVRKAIGGYFTDPSGKGRQIGSTLAGSGEALALGNNDLERIKQKLADAMKRAPEFKQLKDHVQMTVVGEGLRIELLETSNGMFFQSGNSSPSETGSDLLIRLTKELSGLPNHILIEGHTDAKPFSSAGEYSNWELSVDRANSARRLMQENGLRPDQVTEVRGFSDQHLRNRNDPFDPSNRRITVIVQYLDADLAKSAIPEPAHQ